MERPLPRRPQRTVLLFSATFFCSFLGAVNNAVQMPPCQVNGLLRRSVLLSVNVSSEKVRKIEWEFQPQPGKGLAIAEIRDGKWERPIPNDRFGSRLELVNGTTLRIQNLEKEDSGVYNARVQLRSAEVEEHPLHLTVYDPVPEPQILLLQETSDSSSGCNVSLQCSVSEKGGLNVSWRIGDALEPFEGGLDWYWFSSEGWHLHLSNLSNPMDSNVTCLVSNPADRKSTSINLTGTCSHPGGRERLWWLVFPIGIGIGISLVAGFWVWKKRKKQTHSEADSAFKANHGPEVQYMEVQNTRHHSEGNNNQGLGRLSEGRPAAGSPTIYSMVQAPSHRPDQVI